MYPVVPKILQIILFVLIGCTSDIISEVCISEGMDQAPPVSPLHHHQKNMEYLDSTMETLLSDIFIRWKSLGPNHNQVL